MKAKVELEKQYQKVLLNGECVAVFSPQDYVSGMPNGGWKYWVSDPQKLADDINKALTNTIGINTMKYRLINEKPTSDLQTGHIGVVCYIDEWGGVKVITATDPHHIQPMCFLFNVNCNPSQTWGTGFEEVKERYEVRGEYIWDNKIQFYAARKIRTRSQAERICAILNETP